VFSSVAADYDLMNDFMSAGVYRLWKDHLLASLSLPPTLQALSRSPPADSPEQPLYAHLDVAGGTGDVSFRVFDELSSCLPSLRLPPAGGKAPQATVTVCDINPDMLRVGAERAVALYGADLVETLDEPPSPAKPLRFREGNAERLPFDPGSFDSYTIAFGLRNVTDPSRALRNALELLKPGGRLLVLEFSRPPNPVLSAAYDAYSFNVIPPLGAAVAGDEASYRYLVESIRKWDDQAQLTERMEDAGFQGVAHEDLAGGIVALHSGWKL
jgi:ubiquinone/menaquinone biosynthesis methyltransferase